MRPPRGRACLRCRAPVRRAARDRGTAASRLWNGIKANVLASSAGPAVTEASLVGAAILAAVGAGAHPDLRTALAAMTREAERIVPDPAEVAIYDRAFAVYEELHARLAPANAALGCSTGAGRSPRRSRPCRGPDRVSFGLAA